MMVIQAISCVCVCVCVRVCVCVLFSFGEKLKLDACDTSIELQFTPNNRHTSVAALAAIGHIQILSRVTVSSHTTPGNQKVSFSSGGGFILKIKKSKSAFFIVLFHLMRLAGRQQNAIMLSREAAEVT